MKALINRILGSRNQGAGKLFKNAAYNNVEPELFYFDKTQGMITLEEAALLYTLAKELSAGCIVEVGSYRGRSTVALGRGSIDGNRVPVYAIEPHEEFTGALGGKFGPEDRGAFYQAMLETGCYAIVRLVNLSSEIVAPNWTKEIGLLWIDGDHTYEGVKRDFECWLPHLISDAIIAFDDSLHPELGPKRLIHELTAGKQFKKTELVGKITVLRRRR
jgi:hypothetical protein